MKRFLSLILAALASGGFAAELTLNAQKNVVPDTGSGGTLRLEGKFAPQDIASWFFVDFTDASGKSLGKFRFDRRQLLIQPGWQTAGYPAETAGEKFFRLTLGLSPTACLLRVRRKYSAEKNLSDSVRRLCSGFSKGGMGWKSSRSENPCARGTIQEFRRFRCCRNENGFL